MEVGVTFAARGRLYAVLPDRIRAQVYQIVRDRCAYIVTLWNDTHTAYREVEYPESWGIAGPEAVALLILRAW